MVARRSGRGRYVFSLGSMVQKGKFSAGMFMRVRMLKSVDLPTLGMPTIPILRCVLGRPSNTSSGAASFLAMFFSRRPSRDREREGETRSRTSERESTQQQRRRREEEKEIDAEKRREIAKVTRIRLMMLP